MMRTQTKICIFCLALLCLIIFAIQTCTQASLNRLDVPAIRHLPDKYAGGEIIVVTIDVNPFLPAGAKIIEKVPDGWDLVAANPPLAKQPFRNMYVWEKHAKGENLTAIRYAVGVPKGNKSRKEFTGFIDIGKTSRLIVEGDRHIWGE